MKRVVSSSLISVFIIIAVAAGIIYYQKYTTKGARAFDCIPADASFVISCPGASASIRQLARSNYWKDLSLAQPFAKATQQLLSFDSASKANKIISEALTKHDLLLSFHVTGASDFDILFLVENVSQGQVAAWIKALSTAEPTSRSYNGIDIRELNTSYGLFSYAVVRGVFAGSFSSFLVEDAIRQQRSGNKLREMAAELPNHKQGDLVLLINNQQLPSWLNIFLNVSRKERISRIGSFANFSAFTVNLLENQVKFNGRTVADSLDYLHALSSQNPVPLTIKELLPSKTAAFIWHGVSDWNKYLPALRGYFKQNKLHYSTTARINEMTDSTHISIDTQWLYWLGDEYALLVTEPVSTNYDNTCYGIFKTKEVSKAIAALNRLSEKANAASGRKQQDEERYNGRIIRFLDLPGLLPAMFGGLFNRINRFYYTDMEGCIIVANQPSALRSLINDFANGNMAMSDTQFNSLVKHFPNTANFCFYSNVSASTYLVRSIASQSTMAFIDQYKKIWDHWDAFIYSATAQKDAFKADAFFHYKSQDTKGVHQLWSCSLDTTITNAPQFIDDTTQAMRILVQDNNNTLYKIDNSGSIQWKRKLDTKVLSSYFPVDPYKNGQKCYVFNTRSFLYMVDESGSNCPGFPIRLPMMATNSISLIDYYNSGDYRIFLACGNMSIYGWLLNGKPLGGWYFNKTQKSVTDSLQYFKFGSRDYLVFTDEEYNFYALNKMGQYQSRGLTILKKPGTAFYRLNKNDTLFHLMFIDTAGNIMQIKENSISPVLPSQQTGNPLCWIPLDANADREDDFVLLGERSLKILTNDNLLITSHNFSDKMSRWISTFTLSDGKTRVGVLSEEGGNVYLIEKNGAVMKGFPVSGLTPFDILNSKRDNRSFLVTGYGNNIYLYGIN